MVQNLEHNLKYEQDAIQYKILYAFQYGKRLSFLCA
jgi:hypothetical protein